MTNRDDSTFCSQLLHELSALRDALREGNFGSCGTVHWPLEFPSSGLPIGDQLDGALYRTLQRLRDLAELYDCLSDSGDDAATECLSCIIDGVDRLIEGLQRGNVEEAADRVLETSYARWGEYLALFAPGLTDETGHDPLAEEPIAESEDADVEAGEFLRSLLFEARPTGQVQADSRTRPSTDSHRVLVEKSQAASEELETSLPESIPEPALEVNASDSVLPSTTVADQARTLELDEEIRPILLADMSELFSRLQDLILGLGDQDEHERLQELSRTYHTLKGAAGSVGLTNLATAIHGVEEQLEAAGQTFSDGLNQALESSLTWVEEVLEALRDPYPSSQSTQTPKSSEMCSEPDAGGPCGAIPTIQEVSPSGFEKETPDGIVRVTAGRLDELLELATSLMRRRRLWFDHADRIRQLADVARTCSQRLRSSAEALEAHALDRVLTVDNRPRFAQPSSHLLMRGLTHHVQEQADDLSALAAAARELAGPMLDEAESISRISAGLWETLQSVRIVPLRSLFQRLVRVAREASRVEGRRVDVILQGEEIGVERPMLDRLYEPLLHIVRNSVSHGIEPPELRQSIGKTPAGRIQLMARREGNTVVIEIQDDGRGLDRAAIADKARRLGWLSPSEQISNDKIYDIIFRPGFSTRSNANTIAGRGVGMDVVAREVSRLRGRIDLDSQTGKGTRITLRLPSCFALEQLMIIRVHSREYAIPIDLIESIYNGNHVDFEYITLSRTIHIANLVLPVIDVRAILGGTAVEGGPNPSILVARTDNGLAAILVDAVVGAQEIVIKPLGALIAGHPLVTGAGVTTTGNVIMTLDVGGLDRLVRGGRSVWRERGTYEVKPSRPRILVVDDSLSVRRVASRHLHALGFEVDEANDGEQALGKLREVSYRLILTDLEMPRMDGFALIAELGRTGILKSTPIIVSSTRSDPKTRRQVLDLGASAFVEKPISSESLRRVVEPLSMAFADRRA